MRRNALTSLFLGLASIATAYGQNPQGEKAWFLLDRLQRYYPKAVNASGKLEDPDLYKELQKDVLDIDEVLSPTFMSPKDLITEFKKKSGPEKVEKMALDLKNEVRDGYILITYPEKKPDLKSGEKIYKDTCANCHNGAGKTASAELIATMVRKPPDFTQVQAIEKLSPYGVFQVLSNKPRKTVMPDFSELPTEERWALALFVFSIAPKEQKTEAKLSTKLNWQTQMDKTDADLTKEHPVSSWQLRKTLLSQP